MKTEVVGAASMMSPKRKGMSFPFLSVAGLNSKCLGPTARLNVAWPLLRGCGIGCWRKSGQEGGHEE